MSSSETSARLRQGWLNLEYPAHGLDRPMIGVVADGLTLISAPPRRCRPPFYTSRPTRTVQLMLQSRNLRCLGPLSTAAAAYLVLKPLAIVHSRGHPPFARSAIAKCPRRAPPASLAGRCSPAKQLPLARSREKIPSSSSPLHTSYSLRLSKASSEMKDHQTGFAPRWQSARSLLACFQNHRKADPYDAALYRPRHKLESMFGGLKDWRRIHARDDRSAPTFMSAICIAATVIYGLKQ